MVIWEAFNQVQTEGQKDVKTEFACYAGLSLGGWQACSKWWLFAQARFFAATTCGCLFLLVTLKKDLEAVYYKVLSGGMSTIDMSQKVHVFAAPPLSLAFGIGADRSLLVKRSIIVVHLFTFMPHESVLTAGVFRLMKVSLFSLLLPCHFFPFYLYFMYTLFFFGRRYDTIHCIYMLCKLAAHWGISWQHTAVETAMHVVGHSGVD